MEKEKKNKKQIIIGGSILLIVTLLLLGLTYAFYQTNILGNKENQSANLISDNLELIYEDNDESKTVIDTMTEENKSYTNTFTIRNKSKKMDQMFNIILENITNTYEGNNWTYTLKESNNVLTQGIITSKLKKQLLFQTTITKNTTKEYTLEVKYEKQNTVIINSDGTEASEDRLFNGILKFKINIANVNTNIFEDEKEGTLLYAIGKDNEIIKSKTIPGNKLSSKEAELSYTEDDYGTSYYYRGNMINNYINLEGMCFRILRVLGDGAVRLVLANSKGECNEESMPIDGAFVDGGPIDYVNTDREIYVWLTEQVDYLQSNAKIIIERWFKESNLEENNNIVSAPWCNDKSIQTISKDTNGYTKRSSVVFNGWPRYLDRTVSLRCNFFTNLEGLTEACPECNDKEFRAVSLINKVGLLTADEIAFSAQEGWILDYTNDQRFWTMTPCLKNDTSGSGPYMLGLNKNDNGDNIITLDHYAVLYDKAYLRPSIVIAKDVKVSGSGTLKDPYKIVS